MLVQGPHEFRSWFVYSDQFCIEWCIEHWLKVDRTDRKRSLNVTHRKWLFSETRSFFLPKLILLKELITNSCSAIKAELEYAARQINHRLDSGSVIHEYVEYLCGGSSHVYNSRYSCRSWQENTLPYTESNCEQNASILEYFWTHFMSRRAYTLSEGTGVPKVLVATHGGFFYKNTLSSISFDIFG